MPMTDALLVQIGKEVSWGTAAAQTVRLMNMTDFTLNPDIETRVLGMTRGGFAPGSSASIVNIASAATFSQEMSYEDTVLWLRMIFGDVTPTGAGPYVRAYGAPSASAPTPVTYTIAYGESTIGPYKITGALLNSLTITGAVGEVCTVSGDLRGKAISAGSLDSCNDRLVNTAMFHQIRAVAGSPVTFYIDAWGGTIGTTVVDNTLTGFELAITAEKPTRRYAGQVTAGAFNSRKWTGTLRTDVDYNVTTKAIIDAYVAATAPVQRQIRIEFNDTASRQIRMDFAGTITDNPELWGDDDGVAVNPLTWTGMQNTTLGNWLKVQTTTSQANTVIADVWP